MTIWASETWDSTWTQHGDSTHTLLVPIKLFSTQYIIYFCFIVSGRPFQHYFHEKIQIQLRFYETICQKNKVHCEQLVDKYNYGVSLSLPYPTNFLSPGSPGLHVYVQQVQVHSHDSGRESLATETF